MLAFAAIRAGFAPTAIDAFADLDLLAVAETFRARPESFAEDAVAIAETLPPMNWLFGGGFENDPAAIERISRRHRLVGCSPESVREARDLDRIAREFAAEGLSFARRTTRDEALRGHAPVLVKPFRSAGGLGIRRFTPDDDIDEAREYLQEYLPGESLGALYLAGSEKTRLIGATRPIALAPESLPGPFVFAGLEGPVELSAATEFELLRYGDVARERFGLRGLFGVDFVRDASGLRAVEINPRPTASLEILEIDLGRSVLAQHLAEFGLSSDPFPMVPRGFAAKAVVYAEFSIRVPAAGLSGETIDLCLPRAVDLPRPGTVIGTGEPVTTLIEHGEDPDFVREELARRFEDLRRSLESHRDR